MIGIFDSGYGGLTVLNVLIRELPDYSYIYLGDNARAPYGSKSQEVIYNYTREAIDFLFSRGCELIIIACNTASAKALRILQKEFLIKKYSKKRILGVLIPSAEAVDQEWNKLNIKDRQKRNKVGIIGTKATIESGGYDREIKKINKDLKVFSAPCPLLVPLIEEGWIKRKETKMIIRKYLRPLKNKKINYLILGCTHYLFLKKQIQTIIGRKVKIISAPTAVAEKLVDYLKRHQEIEKKLTKNKKNKIYTTDSIGRFNEFYSKFLPELREIKTERVNL